MKRSIVFLCVDVSECPSVAPSSLHQNVEKLKAESLHVYMEGLAAVKTTPSTGVELRTQHLPVDTAILPVWILNKTIITFRGFCHLFESKRLASPNGFGLNRESQVSFLFNLGRDDAATPLNPSPVRWANQWIWKL